MWKVPTSNIHTRYSKSALYEQQKVSASASSSLQVFSWNFQWKRNTHFQGKHARIDTFRKTSSKTHDAWKQNKPPNFAQQPMTIIQTNKTRKVQYDALLCLLLLMVVVSSRYELPAVDLRSDVVQYCICAFNFQLETTHSKSCNQRAERDPVILRSAANCRSNACSFSKILQYWRYVVW